MLAHVRSTSTFTLSEYCSLLTRVIVVYFTGEHFSLLKEAPGNKKEKAAYSF